MFPAFCSCIRSAIIFSLSMEIASAYRLCEDDVPGASLRGKSGRSSDHCGTETMACMSWRSQEWEETGAPEAVSFPPSSFGILWADFYNVDALMFLSLQRERVHCIGP